MPEITAYSCPTPAILAARIASERRRLGLTQREAAAVLGISQSTYKGFEAPDTLVSLATLFGLVDSLGMRPASLLPEWFAAESRVASVAAMMPSA